VAMTLNVSCHFDCLTDRQTDRRTDHVERLINWLIDWLAAGAVACTTSIAAASSSRHRDVRRPRRTELDSGYDHHCRHLHGLSESRVRQSTPLLPHWRRTVRLRQGLVHILYTLSFYFIIFLLFHVILLLFVYLLSFIFTVIFKEVCNKRRNIHSNRQLSAQQCLLAWSEG